MSTDNKDLTPKNAQKKSKKNLIILIILLVFCSVAGFLFFEKSPEKKNEIVEVSSIEDNLEVDEVTEDSTSAVESLIKKDSIELPPVKKLKPIIKKRKRKITKVQLDNNPNYWMVVKESNDTTFYTLKNNKTGTKLSNKYYSKEIAEKELRKFKKIISR
jgi:hypothetical protein